RLLADRLRAIYRQDRPDFLAVLLSTGGISEAVDSLQSLERVGRQDARIIRDLRAARARMIEAREAFTAQRRTARSDLGAAVARRRESEALATARRTVLID